MINTKFCRIFLALIVILLALFMFTGCGEGGFAGGETIAPATNSGVRKAEAKVAVGTDGFTAEQRNIQKRLVEDNKVGAIKHLYVISCDTGQIIFYSTVQGKVTSGGKRLSPTTVAVERESANDTDPGMGGINVTVNGEERFTSEVLQDDGSYGSSDPYVYWWDVSGNYHQHFLSGGQIVHISDKPIRFNSTTKQLDIYQPAMGTTR